MYPSGTRHIAAGDIETTPTETDLVEVYDATKQNVRKAVSLGDLFASGVRNTRTRFTVAQINAGAAFIPAPGAGYAIRMVNAEAIAVGGAAGAVTTVDILGTQGASSVKLVAFAQASLTQSTVLKSGGAGAAVLADGASYAPCDENTAVTVDITGSDVTTATHIDVSCSYVIERV
jgi:hypothetical protein